MMIPIIKKEFIIDDIKIYLVIFKLYKSFLILISDQKEMGIGNVTLGTPPIIEGLKSVSSSYKLFGLEKKLLSTIISEKASKILKSPVLLLLFLREKEKEMEIAKSLLNYLNEILLDLVKED
ncbi:MAG: hypothetical protein EU535_03360 [Promethearchaeota archaeon]|nr:MAG: hypothetical protein EU535_03360 [Candidatus Lokiarchaeota archaeon]